MQWPIAMLRWVNGKLADIRQEKTLKDFDCQQKKRDRAVPVLLSAGFPSLGIGIMTAFFHTVGI
jgi:hypothetical protein